MSDIKDGGPVLSPAALAVEAVDSCLSRHAGNSTHPPATSKTACDGCIKDAIENALAEHRKLVPCPKCGIPMDGGQYKDINTTDGFILARLGCTVRPCGCELDKEGLDAMHYMARVRGKGFKSLPPVKG